MRLLFAYLIIFIPALAMHAEIRGHKWGTRTDAVIDSERAKGIHVKDAYKRGEADLLVLQFDINEQGGKKVLPLLEFNKDNKLFFGSLVYIKDRDEDAFIKVATEFDELYKRVALPMHIMRHTQMMTGYCWETKNSFIFIAYKKDTPLIINYFVKGDHECCPD